MKNLKIYTYTIIRSASKEFKDRVPYCSAILEDGKGTRSVQMLEGYTDDKKTVIGQKLIV